MMVEEGVTENIQDNEGESIAIQDKSDKMVENKKDKEVKLIEEEEAYLIQTQHSSTAACEKEGEVEEMCEEELVDYDEDPAIAEKIEMAKLEKKIESRAHMLMDRAAVNIPIEVPINVGGEETEKVSSTPSTHEEIDWDNVWSNLENHLFQQSPIPKDKKSGPITVRICERNK
jgi:hypothetical protein